MAPAANFTSLLDRLQMPATASIINQHIIVRCFGEIVSHDVIEAWRRDEL